MSIELLPLPYLDSITLDDTLIEKCKNAYETEGKDAAYKTLNTLLYSDEPNQSRRNLRLYRIAMFQTKKAFLLGEGYIEQENNRIIREPLYKKKKWSFLDKNATVKMRNINGRGFIAESQFTLDDYAAQSYYSSVYDASTQLSLKKRGGKAVMRLKRFDFEYKYATDAYYKTQYRKYLFDTFRRVFLSTITDSVSNALPREEVESLYTILGSLSNGLKLSIVRKIRDYILFEQADTSDRASLSTLYREIAEKLETIYFIYKNDEGNYTVNSIREHNLTALEKQQYLDELERVKTEYAAANLSETFIDFLSELHDTLLLPFECIAYLMCALVNPRYQALIGNAEGIIGTHVFGGNTKILPHEVSSLGPSCDRPAGHVFSKLITDIPLVYTDGVTLFDNLFITSDDNYHLSCFSYNKNSLLTEIPLVNKDLMPLDTSGSSVLVALLQSYDTEGNVIAWFVYQDAIITYDCTHHQWLTDVQDPFHLVNFPLLALFPSGTVWEEAHYDQESEQLIFLDSLGNIASYSILNELAIPYDVPVSGYIHFNKALDDDIILIRHIKLLPGYYDEEDFYVNVFIAYNEEECQILEFRTGQKIKKIRQYNYAEEHGALVDVVVIDATKIYLLYENHKIIELSTHLYTPIVFQAKKATQAKIVFGSISYAGLNDLPVYITDDNKIHLIHPLYAIKDRISTLDLPLKEYIRERLQVTRYQEYFIQNSSISLFTNTYYALMNYLSALKYPLSKRS
jgi:hypothetical protein